MNRKLLNGLLVLAVAAGGVGTFTSCKDEDFNSGVEDTQKSLQAQINAIRQITDSEFDAKLLEWLNEQTVELSKGLNPNFSSYQDLLAAVSAMKMLYNQIQAGDISGIPAEFFNNVWSAYYEGKTQNLINAAKTQITQEYTEAIKTAVAGIEEKLKGYTTNEALKTALAELKAELEAEIGETDDALQKVIENLQSLISNYSLYQKNINEILNDLLERPSSIGISQTFNPVTGTLNLPVGVNSTILATYIFKPENNWDGQTFPADAFAHQADASPLYGKGTQWGDIIAAIAGDKSESLLEDGEKYAFTDASQFGNMGGALITLNPASVDFTNGNYNVSLVNSKMETVAEGTLSHFDEMLYFGVSRADEDVNNGLYALNVDATADNFSGMVVDLDKSELKGALKQAVNDKSISNIAHLGETVFKAINNKVPALAVKVSWEEYGSTVPGGVFDGGALDWPTFGDGDEDNEGDNGEPEPGIDPRSRAGVEGGVPNYILSDFDVAAVVAHPLSYGLMIDKYVPNKQLPMLSPLAEYLDKIENKINLTFDRPDHVEMVSLYIYVNDGIVYFFDEKDIDVDNFVFKDNVDKILGTGKYTALGVNLTDEELTILANALISNYNNAIVYTDVVDSINDAVDSINDALDQFEGKVGDIKDYIQKAKDSKLLTYADKLVDFYNKVAERVNNFMADPNHYLQVMMVYSAGDGAHHLSVDPNSPTVFNSANGNGIELFATSYTGDVVVPSYKKWVAITEVNGDYKNAASYNNGSEYLNTVLPGKTQRIPVKLTSDMKGKTLTVTYASVDYRGATSIQNYYIYVK